MNIFFRSSEPKKIIFGIILIQLSISLSVLFASNIQINNINKRIVRQNKQLIGKLTELNTDTEEKQLLEIIFQDSKNDDITTKGEILLNKYGYHEQMQASLQPVLGDIDKTFSLYNFIIVLLGLIPLIYFIQTIMNKIMLRIKNATETAERVVDGNFSKLMDETSEGVFGILALRFNQMAVRLKNTLETLKEDKIFLKNIVSDISHQLKTPLSTLILHNDLMLDNLNMDTLKRISFLIKSQKQLSRMKWLTVSLMKIARLESGSIEFAKESFSVDFPIKKSLSFLQTLKESKNQEIIVNEADEAVFITGDKEWIAEALINILKNCIEHTHPGGRIEIDISGNSLYAVITIRDNGEGINKKDLPHIFERFYKSSNSVKTESVGIGLSLSKTIIEEQGGKITAKSTKGAGTTFTITFFKAVL